MKSNKEYVVLVDKKNQPLGLELKSRVHTANTPMHRAFSLFMFNSQNQLLLQQRALTKLTWPGIWSNSVCGHPLPKESFSQAAQRRANYELGMDIKQTDIVMILPNYTYRYEHKGVVEHEFCPVLVARISQQPQPNPSEVEATRWIAWQEFLGLIKKPNDFSEWCREEATLLSTNAKFITWLENTK